MTSQISGQIEAFDLGYLEEIIQGDFDKGVLKFLKCVCPILMLYFG